MEHVKQEDNKPLRDENGRLLPGNTANPNGRPKGKTIKERVWEYLEQHPDDMQGFVEHFVKQNRELAWQMLEGRPQQDVTSKGEKLFDNESQEKSQQLIKQYLSNSGDDREQS